MNLTHRKGEVGFAIFDDAMDLYLVFEKFRNPLHLPR